VGVGVGALVVLLPLGVVVLASLHDPATGAWSGAAYAQAWQQGHLLTGMVNSALVAVGVTVLQVLTSTLAGYAIARFQFAGRQLLRVALLATLIIPLPLLVIPTFMVLTWGQLINTYGALILPTAASGFGIFLMAQFFQTLPIDLEEAALLDGATRWQVLWRVVFPLARPAVLTLILLTFIGEWNDVFKPLVFTTRPELRTVQLALAELQEQFTNRWSLLMAAVAIATLPIVALFLVGQRQFIQGIATTGLKE
jgi:multiple sugar transport system permease protein